MFATLLLSAALLVAATTHDARDDEYDGDDSDDPAPFMLVVEHEDGWQCAASLVSLRTGVTTASCARGRGDRQGAELWALAATLVGAVGVDREHGASGRVGAGARRVTRVALAGDGRDATDPAYDMAVLELEAPFGSAARVRPILMQNDAHHNASRCHAMHTLPPRHHSTPTRAKVRLRYHVCSLRITPEQQCAKYVPHWAAARARLLCLVNDDDEMCERDLGGGVVCSGKLHGVLSAVGGGEAEGCGHTLAVQSVARWRRFLHCAHTLRQCGRGTCEKDCIEQRLLPQDYGDDESESEDVTIVPSPTSPTRNTDPSNLAEDLVDDDLSSSDKAGDRLAVTAAKPSPIAAAPTRTARPRPAQLTLRASPIRTTLATMVFFGDRITPTSRLEFEPNRPDFKVAHTRNPRVRLKAGEYGDNAADYVAEDAPPPCAGPKTESDPERALITRPLKPTPTHHDVGGSPTRGFIGWPPAPALQLESNERSERPGTSSADCLHSSAYVIVYIVFDFVIWKIIDYNT